MHEGRQGNPTGTPPGAGRMGPEYYRDICGKCGARRIDQQIGLEPRVEDWVATLVEVFAEVKRVLRRDGTVWLNLGDSYACSPNGRKAADITGDDRTFRDKPISTVTWRPGAGKVEGRGANRNGAPCPVNLKPKDLVGQPWRLAFALQQDGWWLRSAITICKNNPMPESVNDRPTQATEMLFLLTRSDRYFYDADAIREAHSTPLHGPGNRVRHEMTAGPMNRNGKSQWDRDMTETWGNPAGRNRRNWWVINTMPLREAHFAAFSEKLVEPCILAGTSEAGVCRGCGAPWRRVVEKGEITSHPARAGATAPPRMKATAAGQGTNGSGKSSLGLMRTNTLNGWQSSCPCDLPTEPATVLDIFAGSGTTLRVATRLGRKSIGIELSETYVRDILRKRTAQGGLGI